MPPAGGAYLSTFEFARNLLADCPSVFLDALGVADFEEAREKIYYQETLAEEDDQAIDPDEGDPPPEMEPRPFIVLMDGDRETERAGIGEWRTRGYLVAAFEVLVPNEFIVDRQSDSSDVIRQKFRGRKQWGIALVGRIEEEMQERSGGSDEQGNLFLNLVGPKLIVPPSDPAASEHEDYIGFAFQLPWAG